MKKEHAYSALLALLVSSTSVSHAEVGLGIQLNPYASTVYLPITLSDGFRLEPSVAYYAEKTEDRGILETRSAWSRWDIALGAFHTTNLREDIRIYHGGRIGYFETNTGSEIRDESGIKMAPTLGFEYFFTQGLSIAGEAAIAYINVNGRASGDGITSTDSSVILRYMF